MTENKIAIRNVNTIYPAKQAAVNSYTTPSVVNSGVELLDEFSKAKKKTRIICKIFTIFLYLKRKLQKRLINTDLGWFKRAGHKIILRDIKS